MNKVLIEKIQRYYSVQILYFIHKKRKILKMFYLSKQCLQVKRVPVKAVS